MESSETSSAPMITSEPIMTSIPSLTPPTELTTHLPHMETNGTTEILSSTYIVTSPLLSSPATVQFSTSEISFSPSASGFRTSSSQTSPSVSPSVVPPTSGSVSRPGTTSNISRVPVTSHVVVNSTTSAFPAFTEVPSSSAPGLFCLNGGTPQGNSCLCKPLFTGQRCQEVHTEIPAGVVATIKVTVKVMGQYHPQMNNLSSEIAQKFVTAFKKQMQGFYRTIVSNFQGIKVLWLSDGSILVDHAVLFFTPLTGFSATYDATFNSLREHLRKESCQADHPRSVCYRNMSRVNLTSEELSRACRNEQVVPKEFQDYFLPYDLDGQALCISSCSPLHPHAFTCVRGTCQLQASGPTCYCEQSDSYWYMGRHCEQSVSKVGVAVGVALGLAALLLLLLVLAGLLCWRHYCRREKAHRLAGLPDEERWYESASERYTGPRDPLRRKPEADSRSASEGGASDDQVSSSGQGSFRPRLDKVDTSLQTRIARPQVTQL
ncbi:mucin-3A-like [Paroedura picta]|uniref:mucin-3A-like n=1 Tax=Paroedura picta TaxID=143630 RepID=UPI0040569A1A